MKRAGLAVVALAGVLALVGCGESEPFGGDQLNAKEVALPDGGTVLCVVGSRGARALAVSCDWENR